jgi:hypothetical protein
MRCCCAPLAAWHAIKVAAMQMKFLLAIGTVKFV